MTRRFPAALALSVLALCAASPAWTASASLHSNNGVSKQSTGPGFATVEHSDPGKFGTASGYEFVGGVGASASARVGQGHGYQNMQVVGQAQFTDAFRVGTNGPNLFDASDGVFLLTVSIEASGLASAQGSPTPHNPAFHSSAIGRYDYSWSIGGQASGGGGVDRRYFADGTTSETLTGDGPAGTFGEVLIVRLNEVVGLTLTAQASAVADGEATASGIADFGHTLRWGGVTSVQFQPNDGTSNTIFFLPDDYLTLVSDGTGFDYMNAAGPNPYVGAAVPEPAGWAVMILGLGGAGAVLRRRRLVPRKIAFESRN